jgi:hypothetical protein
VDLDVDDRFGAVAGGRDAGVLILDGFGPPERLEGVGGPFGHESAHVVSRTST